MAMNIKFHDHPLLEPTAVDGIATVTLLCILLTHKLWGRYLAASDNIPESFWYRIPQSSTDLKASAENAKRTRNILQEISERVSVYCIPNLPSSSLLTMLGASNGHLLG